MAPQTTHLPAQNGPPVSSKVHGDPFSVSKNSEMGSGSHFCDSFERAANGRKYSVQMRGAMSEKTMLFAMYNFSLGEKQTPQSTCLQQHACLVDSSGVFKDFCIFKLSCEGLIFRNPCFEIGPPNLPKAPLRPHKWAQKGTHSKFGRPKRQALPAHLISSSDSSKFTLISSGVFSFGSTTDCSTTTVSDSGSSPERPSSKR